jgi:hypothetical protein
MDYQEIIYKLHNKCQNEGVGDSFLWFMFISPKTANVSRVIPSRFVSELHATLSEQESEHVYEHVHSRIISRQFKDELVKYIKNSKSAPACLLRGIELYEPDPQLGMDFLKFNVKIPYQYTLTDDINMIAITIIHTLHQNSLIKKDHPIGFTTAKKINGSHNTNDYTVVIHILGTYRQHLNIYDIISKFATHSHDEFNRRQNETVKHQGFNNTIKNIIRYNTLFRFLRHIQLQTDDTHWFYENFISNDYMKISTFKYIENVLCENYLDWDVTNYTSIHS